MFSPKILLLPSLYNSSWICCVFMNSFVSVTQFSKVKWKITIKGLHVFRAITTIYNFLSGARYTIFKSSFEYLVNCFQLGLITRLIFEPSLLKSERVSELDEKRQFSWPLIGHMLSILCPFWTMNYAISITIYPNILSWPRILKEKLHIFTWKALVAKSLIKNSYQVLQT